jgi:hypothetical protein
LQGIARRVREFRAAENNRNSRRQYNQVDELILEGMFPFTCTSASPGVLTLPAHGYSNSDTVVVTAKDGGALPTTGGSWSGLLTVAGVTTDTFTGGVNTTGTGDGLVRKVASQVVSNNVTFSISAGKAVLTFA